MDSLIIYLYSTVFALYLMGGALINYYRGGNLDARFPVLDKIGGNWAKVLTAAYLAIPFVLAGIHPAVALPFIPEYTQSALLLGIVLLLWCPGFCYGWGLGFNMAPNPDSEKEVAWIDFVLRGILKLSSERQPITFDVIWMSLRGLHFSVPITLFLYTTTSFDAWGYAFAGLAMGPIYYAASHTKWQVALAEALFGSYLAAMTWGMTTVVLTRAL
ncbi:MAG: hypothetical protein RPU91_07655 [Candidatus Sedimenticola sp. (ex Thyasira tokunagai)]